MAQRLKRLTPMQETWVQSLGREGPLEKEMATRSTVLAWRILWTEKLAGYSPWGHKESDSTEQAHAHHSGIIYLWRPLKKNCIISCSEPSNLNVIIPL